MINFGVRNKQQQEIDPTFIILKIELPVVTSTILKCGSSNNYCCIKRFPALLLDRCSQWPLITKKQHPQQHMLLLLL